MPFLASSTRLPFVEITGSRRAIGRELGRLGRAAVAARVMPSAGWRAAAALAGDPRVAAMLAAARLHVPAVVEELEGVAEGLGLPFADVFVWHCRGDLLWWAAEGCTTVRAATATGGLVVHNEDGDPAVFGDCLIVRLVPDDGPAVTAFAYPGSLPGNAFGANSAGVGVTVNNMRVRDGRVGVPRMLVGRAVLDCVSIDDLVARVSAMPRASGYNLNVVAAGDRRVVGLEFSATRVSVREIDAPSAHANHAVHADLLDLPQVVTASSAARQKRAEVILAASGELPLVERAFTVTADIAGDLPIRRFDPTDPDGENTIATAMLESTPDALDLTVYGGLDGRELHRFSLPAGSGGVPSLHCNPRRP